MTNRLQGYTDAQILYVITTDDVESALEQWQPPDAGLAKPALAEVVAQAQADLESAWGDSSFSWHNVITDAITTIARENAS